MILAVGAGAFALLFFMILGIIIAVDVQGWKIYYNKKMLDSFNLAQTRQHKIQHKMVDFMITSQNDPNFVKNIKKEFLTFYGQLSYEEATDGKFYYKYDFMMDYRTAVKGKFEVYTKKYFNFFIFLQIYPPAKK